MEHTVKTFFTFIDICKAYNSVPREGCLEKLGVPDEVVELTASFHTMAEVREWWGDEELVDEKNQNRRLKWLGYLARMQDHCLPKSVLFGWLDDEWYKAATASRDGWRTKCREGMEDKV